MQIANKAEFNGAIAMDTQATDHSRRYVVWLDMHGRLVNANQDFITDTQSQFSSASVENFFDLILAEDLLLFKEAFTRALELQESILNVPAHLIDKQKYEIDFLPAPSDASASIQLEIRASAAPESTAIDFADKHRLFDVLVESAEEAFYIIDTVGIVRYINPAFKKYGVVPENLIGGFWTSFIALEDQFIIQNAFEQLLQGNTATLTIRFKTETGFSERIRAACYPIIIDGRFAGSKGVVLPSQDVSKLNLMFERRAAQLSLLNRIGEVISSSSGIEQMLQSAVQLLHKSFGYYHVAFFVPEPDGYMRMKARAGAFANLFPPDHRLSIGQGVVGWVAHQRKTALVNDVNTDLRYINLFPDRIHTHAELAMPILIDDELYGIIDLQSPLPNAFEENDIRVIETVAHQLGLAISNARLFQQVQQRLKDVEHAQMLMRLQRDVLADLTTSHDFEKVLQVVLDKLTQIQGIDCGSIYLVDIDGALDMVASRGLTPAFSSYVSFLPPQSNKARMVREGKPIYSRYRDLPLDSRIPPDVRNKENMLSLAAFPIHFHSRIIANLTIGSHTLEEIPTESKDLFESVASQLGSTIARIKIEKELATNEAQSNALLESLPDLFFVCNSHGRFLKYKTSPGYDLYAPPDFFLGKTLHDVLPEEVASPALEGIRKSIATRQTQEVTYTLFSANKQMDEYFEARISAANEDLAIIIIRNITDRMQAQNNIENRERKYRALFDRNEDGVMLLDINGRYIEVNQKAQDLTGYSREELLKMSFHDLVIPGEQEQAQARFAKLVAGEPMPVHERTMTRKDGSLVTFEFNSARVDDANGSLMHIQSLIRDISQRKQLEGHLQRVVRLEKSLAQLSSEFLKTTQNEYIPWAIEKTTLAVEGIRGFLFGLATGSYEIIEAFEWTKPGLPQRARQYDHFSPKTQQHFYDRLSTNQPIIIPNHGSFERLGHLTQLDIAKLGDVIFITMPIFVRNQLHNVLVIEGSKERCEWLPEEISYLRSVAEILGHGIERWQGDQIP